MQSIFTKLFALIFAVSAFAAPGKLQNADFATSASILGAGGSLNQLLNTNKVWDDVNSQLLDTTLANTQGTISLGAFGSSANANGATLSGNVLTLQPESSLFPGGVTTGSQTIAGAKTFSVAPILSGFTQGSVLFVDSGSAIAQDNAKLFFDSTGHKFSIGTASPTGVFTLNTTGFTDSGTPTSNGSVMSVLAGTYNDTATVTSGTVSTYIADSFSATTLSATSSSVTTTTADNVRIKGAVTAGTNETIVNSSALRISAGTVSGGGGTVTNGYGLVVAAPVGATNNYSGAFTGGNFGLGTASPVALLSLSGNLTGTPSTVGSSFERAAGTFTDTATTTSGTVTSYVAGRFVGGTLAATSTSVTTTGAEGFRVTPVVAGSNETITNSYGIRVPSTNVTSGVTNAYGALFEAPSGATNLYSAIFNGNVGMGTITDPGSPLTIAELTKVATSSEQIMLRSTRSAINIPDLIGGIGFMSNDTQLTAPGVAVAFIDAVAEANHTTSILDTGISFKTTTGTTNAERVRITATGNLGVGITTPGSTLSVAGSYSGVVTTPSIDTTLTSSHQFITVDDSAADRVITLPACVTSINGRIYYIKKMGATHTTYVTRSGSDTIDGATSASMAIQYMSRDFVCTSNTAWSIF